MIQILDGKERQDEAEAIFGEMLTDNCAKPFQVKFKGPLQFKQYKQVCVYLRVGLSPRILGHHGWEEDCQSSQKQRYATSKGETVMTYGLLEILDHNEILILHEQLALQCYRVRG